MISDKISIMTMKKIFDFKAKIKCSSSSKMVYQSVLNHYFSDKITNVNLLSDFSMSKDEIKYHKFLIEFVNLQQAELVEFKDTEVLFKAVWKEFINISEFGTAEYSSRITANEIKEELYQSHALNELVRMKYKVTIKKANDLLGLFLQEQLVCNTKYSDEGQVKKHFVYWCQSNVDKNPSIEQAKSSAKILGKNETK